MNRNRTATQKTLLALDHHAKEFLVLAGRIATHIAGNGWKVRSSRGGPNSWELTSPNGKIWKLRAYRGSPIQLTNGNKSVYFKTRLDVDRFFEKN